MDNRNLAKDFVMFQVLDFPEKMPKSFKPSAYSLNVFPKTIVHPQAPDSKVHVSLIFV